MIFDEIKVGDCFFQSYAVLDKHSLGPIFLMIEVFSIMKEDSEAWVKDYIFRSDKTWDYYVRRVGKKQWDSSWQKISSHKDSKDMQKALKYFLEFEEA